MNTQKIILNGETLTVEETVLIGKGKATVSLDEGALIKCRESRAFLEQSVFEGKVIYGVNTSFGPLCNKIIHEDEAERLQINLIRSHAAGLASRLNPLSQWERWSCD